MLSWGVTRGGRGGHAMRLLFVSGDKFVLESAGNPLLTTRDVALMLDSRRWMVDDKEPGSLRSNFAAPVLT